MIGYIIVDDKGDGVAISLLRLLHLNLFQSLECLMIGIFVVPRVGDAVDACKAANLFGCIFLAIVVMASGRGDKDIDAHLAFFLIMIGGKPTEVGILVDDIEVVVGLRVEGHTDIDRAQEAILLAVVGGHIDVVAT